MILVGNALDRLRCLASNSVHCVVTSPPFWGLREYGGTRTWFGGDPTCDHDRDVIHLGHHPGQVSETKWKRAGAKGQESKTFSCSLCGAWEGQLGLEPLIEVYVQHLVEIFEEVYRILRPDGVCWLNLGDTHIKASQHNYKQKDLAGIPWRVALALQDHGWWLRTDIVWNKPNAKPEAVKDRPTRSHEYIFLLTKSADYYYDAEAQREARVVYGQKLPQTRNARSVWEIPFAPYKGVHFAVFPPELPERCIRWSTSAAGCCAACRTPLVRSVEDPSVWGPVCPCDAGVEPCTVLDPFAGSGTTLAVAAYYHRDYIGIEVNPDYVPDIEKRIQEAIAQREDDGDPEAPVVDFSAEWRGADETVEVRAITPPKKAKAEARKRAKAEQETLKKEEAEQADFLMGDG